MDDKSIHMFSPMLSMSLGVYSLQNQRSVARVKLSDLYLFTFVFGLYTCEHMQKLFAFFFFILDSGKGEIIPNPSQGK